MFQVFLQRLHTFAIQSSLLTDRDLDDRKHIPGEHSLMAALKGWPPAFPPGPGHRSMTLELLGTRSHK
ncbi:hypothetical protein CR201_G0031124 [Pongo abelii]|uniref:Uncharacterized protein n=1 Tax=Pongo abelii TaxID=9601 RepID=A0A2J8U1A7_PONAB|nr:hypothetical protein CR201_G0031124 [Pongo abelii]